MATGARTLINGARTTVPAMRTSVQTVRTSVQGSRPSLRDLRTEVDRDGPGLSSAETEVASSGLGLKKAWTLGQSMDWEVFRSRGRVRTGADPSGRSPLFKRMKRIPCQDFLRSCKVLWSSWDVERRRP